MFLGIRRCRYNFAINVDFKVDMVILTTSFGLMQNLASTVMKVYIVVFIL
jgi:hypothetical protein